MQTHMYTQTVITLFHFQRPSAFVFKSHAQTRQTVILSRSTTGKNKMQRTALKPQVLRKPSSHQCGSLSVFFLMWPFFFSFLFFLQKDSKNLFFWLWCM